MQREGRIADGNGAQFVPWEPQRALHSLSQHEVRLSRGFLCANPQVWFDSLAEHWVPFFHALGIELRVTGVRKALDFPPDLAYIVVCDVDGEFGILGFDDETHDLLARSVAPGTDVGAGEVVVEYLERRLLSSLNKSWTGDEPLGASYLSTDAVDEVEVVGSVGMKFELAGKVGMVWFGLGPRLLDRLDSFWKRHLREGAKTSASARMSDNVHSLGVEISELAVPPAMLIDYIRAGTIIDLEVPVSPNVIVTLDGERWAEGELKQFNGMFGVEIRTLLPKRREPQDSTPRVKVEIARTEIEEAALVEYSQPGAVLLTGRAVNANAALVISGENVASALVGQIDGRFALNVLPR